MYSSCCCDFSRRPQSTAECSPKRSASLTCFEINNKRLNIRQNDTPNVPVAISIATSGYRTQSNCILFVPREEICPSALVLRLSQFARNRAMRKPGTGLGPWHFHGHVTKEDKEGFSKAPDQLLSSHPG